MNKKFNTWGALFGVGFLLTASGLAHAATKSWNNPAGGRWDIATNWAPVGVPQNGDDVVINLPGNYTVNYLPQGANNTFTTLAVGGGGGGTQSLLNTGLPLNVTSNATVNTGGVLEQRAGTMGGAGTIDIRGTFNYNGGTIGPGGDLTVVGGVGGTINMGGITKTLQRNVTNNAFIFWFTGTGGLNVAPGVSIVNNNLFQSNVNLPISRSAAGANPVFTNNGTYLRSGGGTTQFNSVNLTNAVNGSVQILGGSLSVSNGTYLQNGNNAVTSLQGGNLASTTTVNVAAGVVQGAGTIAAPVSNTGGTITPGLGAGGTGTLNVTGNYTQGGAGSYNVDVTGPGTFDVLNVTGSATLAGTLNTNVFAGAPSGSVFQILNYASRSGVFAPVNNNGASVGTQYNPTNLQLVVAALTAKITIPVNGTYVNAPNRIRGEFTRSPKLNGTTGLSSVQITIVENQTGLYWNGSSFQAAPASFPAEAVDAPSGTFASNHGPGTNDVTDGYTYTVTATATDANGQSITTAPSTVTVDKTRPTVTADNAPATSSTVTSLNDPIIGTASDPNGPNGTSSGLTTVGLFLRRQSDNKYFNGTNFQDGFFQLFDNSATTAPNSGATVNYSIGGLPQPGSDPNTQLTPGIYVLSVTSYDRALNNSGGGSVIRSFNVVPAAPMALQSRPSALRAAPAPSGGNS